jgi:hypothetical protein
MEQVWLREAAFKVRKIERIRCVSKTPENGIKSDFVWRHEAQSDRRNTASPNPFVANDAPQNIDL